jgi:hypothetical protein
MGHLQAQNIELPPRIDFSQYLVPGPNVKPVFGKPMARIWGWSTTGKVAYSIERHIDGRGGQIIDFVIFNLITDETDLNLKIDSFDLGDNYGGGFESMYNVYKNEILNAMRKYNIVRRETGFMPFPIINNNIRYNCFITNHEYGLQEYIEKYIARYTVTVAANGKRKNINTFNTNSGLTEEIYICGYFLSPYENRALIILGERFLAFEGLELSYRFSGCHLSIGFR